MSKVQTKTDNSFLIDKVELRKKFIPNKDNVKILNCYGGDNEIWKRIEKEISANLDITNIDIKEKNNKAYLQGDNAKFLESLNLDVYDIIDLDAYGVPYQQLKTIFKKKYKGIVFITFIQSVMGSLPNGILNDFGYTKTMLKKCRTIFYKRGVDIMMHFLAINGIRKITYKYANRKLYGYFTTN